MLKLKLGLLLLQASYSNAACTACNSDRFCDTSTDTCVLKKNAGDACSSDAECTGTLPCYTTCRSKTGAGSTCENTTNICADRLFCSAVDDTCKDPYKTGRKGVVATGGVCAKNSECSSDVCKDDICTEACEGCTADQYCDRVYTDGLCTAKVAAGERCDEDGACTGSLLCKDGAGICAEILPAGSEGCGTVENDRLCPKLHKCSEDICRTSKTEGDACEGTWSGDESYHHQCSVGFCEKTKLCTATLTDCFEDYQCNTGEAHAGPAAYDSGRYLGDRCGGATLTETGVCSKACARVDDCRYDYNLFCGDSGVCQNKFALGDSCSKDDNCLFGYCGIDEETCLAVLGLGAPCDRSEQCDEYRSCTEGTCTESGGGWVADLDRAFRNIIIVIGVAIFCCCICVCVAVMKMRARK